MPWNSAETLHIDPDRAEALADEAAGQYWQFPNNHPIRCYYGPAVMAMANKARRRVYVFSSGQRDALPRCQQVMTDIRNQANPDKVRPAQYTPDGKRRLRSNPWNVPALLVEDWKKDGPEAFTWTIIQYLPPRFWNDPRFGQGKGHRKEYTHYLRGQMAQARSRLREAGWEVYNPPELRGTALPGYAAAYQEKKAAYLEDRAEDRRNHQLRWENMTTIGSIGLDPSWDPMDPDVQRAFARHQYAEGNPQPWPGGPMRGHTRADADKYKFQLPEGELTYNCPPDCPRRRPGQVDNALSDA